jgi:signal transduction histidine kinase
MKMPGGGSRAVRDIGSGSPETKVLALSAYDDRGSVVHMLRAGAIGYLVKGGPKREILEAIRLAAEGRSSLSREVVADVIEELVATIRQAEEQSRELQHLDQVKREILQILSHEVLTPVTVIQATAGVMSRPELDPGDVPRLVEAIRRSADRLKSLMANLGVVARLDGEGMSASTLPVALVDVVDHALEEIGGAGDRIRVSRGDRVTVWADRSLASRAVAVLVDNALRLSGTEPVDIVVERGGLDGVVAVRDRGPGVPADRREAIFELFTQGDASETRTHGGTGVGLFLARRIMQAHGGTVTVSDRPGGGSLFALRFPVVQEEERT